ncbi:hypothetical protein ACHAXT_001775 [Thalassiosira profunda]
MTMSESLEISTSAGGGPPPGSPMSPRARKKIELKASGLLTDDQIDIVLQNLEEEERATIIGGAWDGVLGKTTWSRYLVENYFSKMRWYYPNRDNEDAPSLGKGWAYFEHFTLPRRFHAKSGGHHTRAPPGEAENTKLYSVLGTPQESLSDWGIGTGMYFSSLSAVVVIFLLAGCLSIANMTYYASAEYDPGRDEAQGFQLLSMVRLSTICTDREWVVCADGCKANIGYWDSLFTDEYYGTATDANGEEVTLINRTKCLPAEFQQGMINYGTTMLLIVCMSLYNWFLVKKEVRFDEDNTGAPDYTVVVHNPPPDALDPDEWRDFFDKFSVEGVTLVTVALNNEPLLNKLVQRRKDIKALRSQMPRHLKCDFLDGAEGDINTAVENAKKYREGEEARRNCLSKLLGSVFTPLVRLLGLSPTETTLWQRIKKTTKEIDELQKQEYQAAAVYVTFETEMGQRTALEALSCSETEIMLNRPKGLDSSALFQGRVLRAEEACEPTAVERIDLINTVNALMISEMIVSPLLRYLDPMTILSRHFLAPRAKTEEALLDCFQGGYYNLAERFTDFTKVLLICTFYSAFYPLIWFLGAAILFGQYWMDKFLLLRSWQKAPSVGTETAKFSRFYFNTAAILLGAISSGYAYARSPYTQLCSCTENDKACNIPGTQFTGVTLINGENKWMTEGQEELTKVYGTTVLVLLILYCVFILGQGTIRLVLSLVRGVYKPKGRDQRKDFSSGVGSESFGYIPQLEVPGFHFPLLACNIDDIDVRLLGWKDPNSQKSSDPHRNYDNNNLIFDVPRPALHRSRNVAADENGATSEERTTRPIFSVAKHYPPKWAMQAKEEAKAYAESAGDASEPSESPRSYLRRVTGFSLTALRSTLRAATGFSLTAFRATIRAATGISLSQTISGSLRRIMGVMTPGMRYFLQPLLILYYAPQLVVKYWLVGPSNKYVEESLKSHERVVEGWRKAVQAAEKASDKGYWPVHVNDDGTITTALPPDPEDVLDLTEGIEKSVAAAAGAVSDEGLSP